MTHVKPRKQNMPSTNRKTHPEFLEGYEDAVVHGKPKSGRTARYADGFVYGTHNFDDHPDFERGWDDARQGRDKAEGQNFPYQHGYDLGVYEMENPED